jgi:predicted SAM-dependent methyltransferase
MGVPVIALAGASHVSRVGVSLLTNAGLSELIGRDIDEYVTLAVALANDVGRLQQFRSSLRDRLRVSTVCDAVGFTRTLENSYREMWHHWCARSRSMPPDATPPNEAKSPRRLHIGGTARSDGWEVLNANAAPYVDHVCNANDLAQFADDTFAAIYASHIVEHFDYANELASALREWNRVLVPGGKAYISVPDLDVLARLFLEKDRLTADERFFVMRMIFGGHVDRYDYHAAGLNEEFLARFLTASGYVNIKRVQQFDLFDDTSSMLFKGVAISLNMVAEKPGKSLGAQERALNSVPRTSK